MHHEGSLTPASPPAVAHALSALWREVATAGLDELPRDRLRQLAGEVSAAALDASYRPEQLVVSVKESWSAHPELWQSAERSRAQRTLSDVVSMCIRLYFRQSDD